MKSMKCFFCLLTLVLMGIALLATCSGLGGGDTGSGSRGRKLRGADVIIDYGVATRGGEQTIVCAVCDQNAIYLYCGGGEHELFDTAMLPTEKLYDREVRNEDQVFSTIDFNDVTDDNNGDLQVTLSHSDMGESYLTWMWEEGEGYVHQPGDFTFYHSIVARYPDEESEKPEYDFSMYEGLWRGDADAGSKYDCDEAYLESNAYGYWELYSGGDWIDAGYLWYEPDWDATHIYCHQGGSIGGTINGSCVEPESDQLSISDCGCSSREDAQTYHLVSSVLQDIWYPDNDCSMENYIVISDYGDWSSCQRKPGSSETEEIDHGTFSFETDGLNILNTDSHVNETSLRVFYFEEDGDDGVIVWSEGDTYYRMEQQKGGKR